jgi:hypothetical protein
MHRAQEDILEVDRDHIEMENWSLAASIKTIIRLKLARKF